MSGRHRSSSSVSPRPRPSLRTEGLSAPRPLGVRERHMDASPQFPGGGGFLRDPQGDCTTSECPAWPLGGRCPSWINTTASGTIMQGPRRRRGAVRLRATPCSLFLKSDLRVLRSPPSVGVDRALVCSRRGSSLRCGAVPRIGDRAEVLPRDAHDQEGVPRTARWVERCAIALLNDERRRLSRRPLPPEAAGVAVDG